MVEGTTDRVSYTCNGGKGPYAIPSDMSVSLTSRGNATNLKVVLVDPDGTEDQLTLTTEYTVTGRNVYTVSNYSSSYTIVIARSMPFTQERDLRNHSTLNMEHLETAFDAACLERRELLEQIGRQLVFPISDPDGLNYELPIVANRASSFIACDASGNVIAAAGVTSVPISTFMEDVLDDTTGAAALNTLGVTASPEEVNEAADKSARMKLINEEDYTILDDDGYSILLVVTGDTNRDIDIPTAADNTGRILLIKKLDTGTGSVTLTFEAGEDEVNIASLTSQHGRIQIISNGTDWYLVDYWDSPLDDNVSIDGTLDVTGGVDLDSNVSVSGTLTVDDGMDIGGHGSAVKIKEVAITIEDTDDDASGAHGISNAKTNDRILGVIYRNMHAGNKGTGWMAGSPYLLKYVLWDDTNLSIASGANAIGDLEYKLTVFYV